MRDLPKNRNLGREKTEKMQKLLSGNMTDKSVDERAMCNCGTIYSSGNGLQELEPCPFCGNNDLHIDSITDDIGTEIPIIFCNSCKTEFHVENDSPYMDDKRTKEYLHRKNIEVWNRRA